MGYKLKQGQEEFTIVDGPLAGMNYKRNIEYPKAPEGYESRFEYSGSSVYQEDAEAVNVSNLYASRKIKQKSKESENEAVKDTEIPLSTATDTSKESK